MSTGKAQPVSSWKGAFSRGHILALGLIFVLCAGLFLWAGAVFLPDAIGHSRGEIVNDDYAVIEGPIGAGDELRQEMVVDGRLYGVVLDVATYNRVARGTLHLRVENEQGEVVARNDTDMTNLLDNTFHRFVFDTMIDAKAGERYTLVITVSPDTPEDALGFWRSDGPAQDIVTPEGDTPHYILSDFSLSADGQPVDGMLALQYLTRYSDSFIVGVYSFFAAALTTFFLLLYVFVFMRKTPFHRIFLFCSLVLGSVFLFLIPPRTAPDEYAHIATTYHYSNVVLGQPEIGEYGTLTVRAGDEMKLHNYDPDATSIFAYQDVYETLFARAPDGEPVVVQTRPLAGVFPLLYVVPSIGVVLARLFGFSTAGLLLCGRLANLIFYSTVVSRAVKRMPVAKPMLLCVGLLPMSLQLAASFSYDTYVMALSFYFIALCFDFCYHKKEITSKNMIGLGILAVLLAPAKAVYLLLVLLIFFIPGSKYKSKKQLVLSRASVFAAAILAWSAFNLSGLQATIGPIAPAAVTSSSVDASVPADALTDTQRTPLDDDSGTEIVSAQTTTPTQEKSADETVVLGTNGDATQKFSISYILRHIPQTAKLLLQTLWTQGPLWLQGLLGGRLGEIIAIKIEVNWLFVIGLLFILCMATLPNSEDKLVPDAKRRVGALGIALGVSALFLLACIFWTPINYTTIFGVQGRYFLPVLPLLFFALRGGNLRFRKPVARQLVFALSVLVMLCQLNAFVIIIGM